MAVQSGQQVSTQLMDMPIIPELFQQAVILRMLNTNAFVRSGVMIEDPLLNAFLNNPDGGQTISPRWMGPLGNDDPNISNDNPEDKSTPKKVKGGKNRAVRQTLNQSWSVMDITAELNGVDPMTVVTNQLGDYWTSVGTVRSLASLHGVVAADLASGDPVLTLDLSGQTGTDALFSPYAFIDAKLTMGDQARNLTTIAVHSTVYGTMLKQNLIDFVQYSKGEAEIPTYQGLSVIVDDAMTYEAGTDGGAGKFYSYLFGRGAIAFGVGSPKTPVAVHRDEAAGNGGGEEVLHSRVSWIIHPQGFSFALDTTPTLAQLADGTNWERVFERKRIALAALITQG